MVKFLQVGGLISAGVLLLDVITPVLGGLTQIGNIAVDADFSDKMVDDCYIISFVDDCSYGTTSQDRSNELMSIFPCITPLPSTGETGGFVSFSTDIHSFFVVQISDESCIDTTTDLSHLCIDEIGHDFQVDQLSGSSGSSSSSGSNIETPIQTQHCINVDVFENGPLPYSYSLDSFDTFDNAFETYLGNSESVDAYVIDLAGIIDEHEEFFKVETLFLPFVNSPPYDTDDATFGDHGTRCASIMVGANYGVCESNQVIYNVYTRASFANILVSLGVVRDNLINRRKRGVINMSFIGYPSQFIFNAFYNALREIIDNGGIPVAAAGNEGWDVCSRRGVPASLPNVVNVGAHDINYNVAWFSNYGECVDIYGPGVNVVSAEGTLNQQGNGLINGNEYGSSSGTSFAAPNIAGVIMNWLVECEKTGFDEPCRFDNIKERLSDWTVPVNPLGNTDQCGSTGVPCEAAQYFCGRPFWPRETDRCVWTPCAEYESGNCMVYNYGSGCSQCEGGSFKISDNHPCQKCYDVLGPACKFCQDYQGCGQCIDNNNYYLITDGNTGLRYCKPQPCLNRDNNCRVCNNGLCSQCNDGYTLNSDGKSCSQNW